LSSSICIEVLQDSDFFKQSILFFSINLLARIVEEFLGSKENPSSFFSKFFAELSGVSPRHKLLIEFYFNFIIFSLFFCIKFSCLEDGSVI